MKPHIFWDLDGTLTDPQVGIIKCFQHALQWAQLPVPSHRDLLWVIGPPIQVSFARLVPQAEERDIWDLVAKYRERFAEVGMYENEVYMGIQDMLKELPHRQHYLATSKPHFFATQIMKHFQLDVHFTGLYGSELNGVRSEKAELMKYILEQENLNASEVLMIGDRKYDMIGAKTAGITPVGITWGYGNREELEEAGAQYVFNKPEDLKSFLK